MSERTQERPRCDDCPYPRRDHCPMECVKQLGDRLDTAVEALRDARNRAHGYAFFARIEWKPEALPGALNALHTDLTRLEERLTATLRKLEGGTDE